MGTNNRTEFNEYSGAILPGGRTNTTTKPSQKTATRRGIATNTPKEDEATVEPQPQQEHHRKKGYLPQKG